jgi:WD40 repeat protein
MNSAGTVQCPYQGLDPFSERDAELFFGRDAEVEVVSANLLTAPLTLLYGDSGVGKSSLLRAGLVPHLKRLAEQENHYLGRPPFEVVIVDHWQGDPLAAIRERLESALSPRLGDQPAPVCKPGRFVEYLAEWTDRLGGLLLFVFDQFEEYLRYHEGESGETSFAEEFPRAVRRPDLKVNFLLAVREDEYARLDRFKARLPGLYRNYLRLRYLGLAAAREAIERPLAAQERDHPETTAPHRIEPALVDAILEDVRTGRVVLGEGGLGTARPADAEAQIQAPYLQLVLKRMWEAEVEAGSPVMRLATYEERLGKAKAIVRSHLDHALSTLAQEDQALAAGAFRHLVTPSGAKVAHSVADLAGYTGADKTRLETVLDRLCGPLRILRAVAPSGTPAGSRRFEIYTDSLAPAVLDWGNRIRRAQERAEAAAQLAEERRRRLVLLRLSVGLALAFLLATMLGVYAWRKQREATVRGLFQLADAQLELSPTTSVELMVKAAGQMWLQPHEIKLECERRLRKVLLQSHERPAPATRPAGLVRTNDAEWVSPDGRLRFVKGPEKGVLNQHRSGPGLGASAPPQCFDTQLSNEVLTVEFDRESSLIAVCGAGGVNVWNMTTTEPSGPFCLPHPDTVVRAAAFLTSNLLVTVGDDGVVGRWTNLVGSSSRVTVGKHSDGINAVAVSPDGRFLATGSDDRTAVVWDIYNARQVVILRGHTNAVTRVQFSEDGQFVWTCDAERTVRYWASRIGVVVARAPQADSIVAAAPTSAGVLFVSRGPAAGGIWKWDPSSTDPAVELAPVGPDVTEATFSANAKWGALAKGNQVEIRDLETASQPPVVLMTSNRVVGLAFSSNAELLATLDEEGEALVWCWQGQTHGRIYHGSPAENGHVLFGGSSGERLIVASGNDPLVFKLGGATHSQDLLTNAVVPAVRHEGIVQHLALSANGICVLSVGNGGTARVWRLEDRQAEVSVKLSRNQDALLSGAFSPDPDARFLLIGGEDGVACVCDPLPEKPSLIEQPLLELPGHRGPEGGGSVCAVWFDTRGSAYTAGQDGTIRRHEVFELRPYPALVKLARDRLGVSR